jgi:hypothetical protein
MAKKKLYEYAVIWHPNEAQEKEGKSSKVLVDPSTVLEVDVKVVGLKAAMAIPDEYKDQLDQIEIAVRPF